MNVKYYDSNGDGRVAPIDALIVLNHLAKNNVPIEAESAVGVPAVNDNFRQDDDEDEEDQIQYLDDILRNGKHP
ncbi:MAG: dockerin type I domain-containing protein [Pirellulaceae bacterium]